MIAWDTETCLIQQGLLAPPLVAVSWAKRSDDGTITKGIRHWEDALGFLQHVLSGVSVGMNTPFDLAVVAEQYPELLQPVFDALEQDRVYDVMTREKLLDIAEGIYEWAWSEEEKKRVRRGYSLADMAKRYLGVELEKGGVQLRFHEVRDLPLEQWPQEFVDYAVDDADVTLLVFEAQEERAKVYAERNGGHNPLEDQFRQFRAHWWLHLASCWGIRTDKEKVRALEKRLQQRFKEVEGQLISSGLLRANKSRDTKKAKALLIEKLGMERVRVTPTGTKKMQEEGWTKRQCVEAGYVKVDEESCRDSGDPLLIAYAEFAHLVKLDSTYLQPLWHGTVKPIQTRFNSLRETGRTSSSGPNLQNPPREDGVRQCYVPRPGCVFIGCDYDKAELHALSQLCIDYFGHSKLAERLRAGFDPHLDLAAGILGIDYKAAVQRKKRGDKEVKEARQMAKAANFGYPGGLGANSFASYAKAAYGVIITPEQAKHLKNYWLDCWPEMRQYFELIGTYTDSGHTDYLQPRSKRIRGHVPFTVACNTGFQGCAADGAKAAGWEICRRQYTVRSSALYGTRTVNFIHDEFILEAREDIAHEAAHELAQVMMSEFNKFTPDVPVNAEPVLMRCWEKDAEPVYVNGRLVPWERQQAA